MSNEEPSRNDLPPQDNTEPLHIQDALSGVLDEIISRAEEVEKSDTLEREHRGDDNPILAEIEREIASIRLEQQDNDSPELNDRLEELRRRYNQELLNRGDDTQT